MGKGKEWAQDLKGVEEGYKNMILKGGREKKKDKPESMGVSARATLETRADWKSMFLTGSGSCLTSLSCSW